MNILSINKLIRSELDLSAIFNNIYARNKVLKKNSFPKNEF